MRRIATAAGALFAGALTLLAAAPSATAADGAWSVKHGAGSASGVIRPVDGKSLLQGELRGAGPECYSLLIQPMSGVFPLPSTKVATHCGAGATPVNREYVGTPNLMVCRGSAAPFADCGPAQRLPEGFNPPQGYVKEAEWLGTEAMCRAEGDKGVAAGRWSAYLCRSVYRTVDVPMLYQQLYVKK
ncbi:hypothetical protein ACFT4A_12660 [Streptomyces sp. NPDC057099]|uniref:hypothetical protein n=1 Tax=Streptomyces sp. NPDC057099 TaxID=3346019 RepID=UPI0036262B4E